MSDVAGDGHARANLFASLRSLHWAVADRAIGAADLMSKFNDPKGMYAYCFCEVGSTVR
jgi:hypothetical protein